jgi:hypothetical protein
VRGIGAQRGFEGDAGLVQLALRGAQQGSASSGNSCVRAV